ncbi:MAG: hypothetical protein IJE74_04535 [Clostridia bacterium]|nr:hypothetical protein [Clostridia bacterium]
MSKKMLIAVSLLLAGMAALILSEMTADNSKAEQTSQSETSYCYSSDDYISDLENRLISIISAIEGAGETKVMVTLESGCEDIYLHDYDYGENSEVSGRNSIERKDEYVIVDGGAGEQGIVVRVAEPKIRGVAVVCRGAGSEIVKGQIIEAVTALLDISSARVSVAKMN